MPRPLRIVRVAIVADATQLLLVHSVRRQLWQLPGGKVQRNEPVPHGACREVREETGLSLKPRHLTEFLTMPIRSHNGLTEAVHFFGASVTKAPTDLKATDDAEIDAVSWFDLPALNTLAMTPTSRHLTQSVFLLPLFLAA